MYELKSGLIHLLPKFHGLTREDPHKHLKEFHVTVGDSGRLYQDEGISILPGWSSKGLVVSSTNTFQHVGRYEAYLHGEILSGIQNSIHKERNLWDKAAHKRDSARVLGKIQQTLCHLSTPSDQRAVYFYEGLSMMDRSMIDAASGGDLMVKTPAAARHLISNNASNTQQFGIRGSS
ncbi:hypothetical protein CR513_36163, partial [Mucuna pruriens]